jgi:SAM-dependent methyltransferase
MDDAYDPTAYGINIAQDYDGLYDEVLETSTAVTCLAELAGDGPVLEFGIGTGRLALPLKKLGLEVHGVEASEDMVARLRAKPGGADLPVVIGDFADVSAPGRFSLVLLAVNTIFALPDQDAQVRCFVNASRHLEPGGRFVVEAWVPDLMQFHNGSSVRPRKVGGNQVALVITEHDPVRQLMNTVQLHLSEAGVRRHPVNHRYAWPSELDLMARLSGMRLEHRWSGWDRTSFTAHSTSHVSVYELVAGAVQPEGTERGMARH